MSGMQEMLYSVTADDGLIHPAEQYPTPNQDARPGQRDPELVVLHGISLPPGEFGGAHIEQFFANCLEWNAHPYFAEIRDLRVSSHLLIRRDGRLMQFVPFHCRAWHAGESSFRGRDQCNDFSIGIELEGCDDVEYTDAQYDCLVAVMSALIEAYPALDARRLAAHSDIAPGRKTDPGAAFDWLRLYDGLSAPL